MVVRQWNLAKVNGLRGQKRALMCNDYALKVTAIVTGIGSVLMDNPSMTVRIDSENQEAAAKTVRQPLRVIMDTALSILPEAKILLSKQSSLCVLC